MTDQQRNGDGNGNGSSTVRTVVLLLATLTTGLLAGFFVNWSNAVMPGLSDVDDRTFVTAFRALDSATTNPLFLGVGYTGSLIFTGLAAALHLRPGQRPVLIWTGAALVCCLIVFAITFSIHEPLNVKLRDATVPTGTTELAALRAQLDETMWTTWNTIRAVAATIGFACLTWALVIHRQPAQVTSRATERPATRPSRPHWDTRRS